MTDKFQNIFDAVQMDETAKKVFLSMPREEQLLAIIGMQAWIRSELAGVKKDVIEIRKDQTDFERELRRYREMRERREKKGEEDVMTTTQKVAEAIRKEFQSRFDFWVWFRDKILPQVISLIVLAILYLTFGGK